MQVLCLTHVPFEGPARIENWAEARGHRLETVRADLSHALPEPQSVDFLVVMGGPMSVNDSFAWLKEEAKYIERVLSLRRRVLGVCLGAQLLARIFGARVYPSGKKEIGWWPVRRVKIEGNTALPLPEHFTPLHWHGETFDLPTGARRLAQSEAIPNQAFLIEDNIVGLQFHIEATPESVTALVNGARADIDEGQWQEPADSIIGQSHARCGALESACYAALDWLEEKPLK